jgi:transcriptional regulator with XRE-family HTH domain
VGAFQFGLKHIDRDGDLDRRAALVLDPGRKNGSIQSLNRLARALGVPIESLIEDEDEEFAMGET